MAFLVYAMALWTYTLLPLPDPEQLRCTTAQLRSFQFVQDIQAYDIAGPSAVLHNPAVIQVALNVLLFVPLGFFLKALWGRGIITTTAVGFGLTLLIETTQLTGVWGGSTRAPIGSSTLTICWPIPQVRCWERC